MDYTMLVKSKFESVWRPSWSRRGDLFAANRHAILWPGFHRGHILEAP